MDPDSPSEISPPAPAATTPPMDERRQRLIMIGIVVGVLILVAFLVVSVIFMVRNPATTVVIRDIFIVFMALQSLLLGLVLVILIIQLARLINLLQNEIKPILESTNETVSTLRGTTSFLSDHLAEPIIKLNEYLAGLQQFFKLLNIGRGKPKRDKSQGE